MRAESLLAGDGLVLANVAVRVEDGSMLADVVIDVGTVLLDVDCLLTSSTSELAVARTIDVDKFELLVTVVAAAAVVDDCTVVAVLAVADVFISDVNANAAAASTRDVASGRLIKAS
jgi:hypothetical protein